MIIVNIVGLPRIGVSTLCLRVRFALEAMGISVNIVAPKTLRAVTQFENDVRAGDIDADVVLIDNHGYTKHAIRTESDITLFDRASIRPDFSILVTAEASEYLKLMGRSENATVVVKRGTSAMIQKYRSCDIKHWGSERLHILSVNGSDGRLYTAGNVKRLILRELARATDTIA